jgi:hypothetical protein
MTQPPGWFPDPFGRYQQRYHDGTAWTAHVVGPDGPVVDPLGASTVVPFVLPSTARPSASSPWPPPKPADRRG